MYLTVSMRLTILVITSIGSAELDALVKALSGAALGILLFNNRSILKMCFICHGAPGHDAAFAQHMYPPPPQMWQKHGARAAGDLAKNVGRIHHYRHCNLTHALLSNVAFLRSRSSGNAKQDTSITIASKGPRSRLRLFCPIGMRLRSRSYTP